MDSQTVFDLVRSISTAEVSLVALKPMTPGSNSINPMVPSEWGWYDGNVFVKTLSFFDPTMDNLDSTGGQCLGYQVNGEYKDVSCSTYLDPIYYYYCEFVESSM